MIKSHFSASAGYRELGYDSWANSKWRGVMKKLNIRRRVRYFK